MAKKQSWMPKTAGILSIIAGAFGLLAGMGIGALGALISSLFDLPGLGGIIGFPIVILGIVAIIGGIFSLVRRVWGLALAGAICALFCFNILGILAIIFVAVSKQEFK